MNDKDRTRLLLRMDGKDARERAAVFAILALAEEIEKLRKVIQKGRSHG